MTAFKIQRYASTECASTLPVLISATVRQVREFRNYIINTKNSRYSSRNVYLMMHLTQAIRATTASKISTSASPRRVNTAAHATTWKTTTSVPVWKVSKVGL